MDYSICDCKSSTDHEVWYNYGIVGAVIWEIRSDFNFGVGKPYFDLKVDVNRKLRTSSLEKEVNAIQTIKTYGILKNMWVIMERLCVLWQE